MTEKENNVIEASDIQDPDNGLLNTIGGLFGGVGSIPIGDMLNKSHNLSNDMSEIEREFHNKGKISLIPDALEKFDTEVIARIVLAAGLSGNDPRLNVVIDEAFANLYDTFTIDNVPDVCLIKDFLSHLRRSLLHDYETEAGYKSSTGSSAAPDVKILVGMFYKKISIILDKIEDKLIGMCPIDSDK